MDYIENFGVNPYEVVSVDKLADKELLNSFNLVDDFALGFINSGDKMTFVIGKSWELLSKVFNTRVPEEVRQYSLMGVPGSYPNDVEVILYHIGKSLMDFGTTQVEVNELRFDLDNMIKGSGEIALLEPLSACVELTTRFDLIFNFDERESKLKYELFPRDLKDEKYMSELTDDSRSELLNHLITGYYALFRKYK